MKAIILAAGKWTRLRPITNTVPKPLIKIVWKSILEHNLENIYSSVTEIIIVVKYLKEKIIEELWDNYKWTPITYHEQWDFKWTWSAIKWIEASEDILLLNWDSIFWKEDIDNLISIEWYWCLVKEVEEPSKYWIFKHNNNFAEKVVEKPKEDIWNLASIWAYKFSSEILEDVNKIKLSERWEYELTCALNLFIKNNRFKLITIQWEFIDVWYPRDILTANKYFLDKLDRISVQWEIEEWVTIKWNVIVEDWAILKAWTYIEWNCYIWAWSVIWPNTYLRWSTVIWKNCKIWNAVEVKNSSIWDNTNIPHLSYIWDSIVWNNTNLWWWFITANLRHDSGNIKAMSKWELINTWLRKLWAIIWDDVKTWMNTSVYPWRTIDTWTTTTPWEIVK